MVKKVYCIRHGQATHNIDFKIRGEIAYIDPIHKDSKLTSEGIKEAEILNKHLLKIKSDIILVSPLTRTIQTCLLSTNKIDKKILSLEEVREFPCGIHTPNNRKTKNELIKLYPEIDFSEIIENEDIYWNHNREENYQELDNRINKFKVWIKKRPENNFLLFSHASFISRLLEHKKYQHIRHCDPYLLEI